MRIFYHPLFVHPNISDYEINHKPSKKQKCPICASNLEGVGFNLRKAYLFREIACVFLKKSRQFWNLLGFIDQGKFYVGKLWPQKKSRKQGFQLFALILLAFFRTYFGVEQEFFPFKRDKHFRRSRFDGGHQAVFGGDCLVAFDSVSGI